MKNVLLLLTGAGIGIAVYAFFVNNGSNPTAADETGAWGTGKRVSGAGNSLKGSVKEGFGELTGDRSAQASGVLDKVKGAAQDAVGSAAQKISDVAHNAG